MIAGLWEVNLDSKESQSTKASQNGRCAKQAAACSEQRATTRRKLLTSPFPEGLQLPSAG